MYIGILEVISMVHFSYGLSNLRLLKSIAIGEYTSIILICILLRIAVYSQMIMDINYLQL